MTLFEKLHPDYITFYFYAYVVTCHEFQTA